MVVGKVVVSKEDEDKLSVSDEWAYILLDPDFAEPLRTDDIILFTSSSVSRPTSTPFPSHGSIVLAPFFP